MANKGDPDEAHFLLAVGPQGAIGMWTSSGTIVKLPPEVLDELVKTLGLPSCQ